MAAVEVMRSLRTTYQRTYPRPEVKAPDRIANIQPSLVKFTEKKSIISPISGDATSQTACILRIELPPLEKVNFKLQTLVLFTAT